MKSRLKSLRTPLGKVRALGPARGGTTHWWLQRITALGLVILTFILMGSFFQDVVMTGGYDGAIQWISSPFSAVFVILFIGVAFHHAVSGLQVVIEDYVHCECAKLASIIVVKFAGAALALLGVIAVIKIFLFSLPPMPHA